MDDMDWLSLSAHYRRCDASDETGCGDERHKFSVWQCHRVPLPVIAGNIGTGKCRAARRKEWAGIAAIAVRPAQ
ncbi:hypothetical protein [Noviherbaspirillum sp.]|uniref:hypothetical protein n=1 Tax=Noviherbaspirillum sp. TaxID=1926288 RepID=UPI0025D1982E|nr:hypothetical protein [Noviherbaspirillum sp.]